MKREEHFYLRVIKSKVKEASDSFLKRAYMAVRKELLVRGLLKKPSNTKDG